MAGTAVRGRLNDQGGQSPQPPRLGWQTAMVDSVDRRDGHAGPSRSPCPTGPGDRAGQHLDVRLTAEDGYEAERSYSIASAPGEPVAITVERLDDGEVSPYLTEELRAGDEIELRGPIGGYFVWDRRPGRRGAAAAAGRRFGDRAAAGHPAAPVPDGELGPGAAAVLRAELGRGHLPGRAGASRRPAWR